MREVLRIHPPVRTNTEWRSRDAADRLYRALQDPHLRPRWVKEIKLPKHKRNKHPSVLVVCRETTYGIKALRSESIARQYRKDHPDSEAMEMAILPDEPLSQIRVRVYGMLLSRRRRRRQ